MKHRNYTSPAEIGKFGERVAAHYLMIRGYTVKERNYRDGHREIDLIVSRFSTIAFVEVKTRTYSAPEIDHATPPRTAVDNNKIRLTRQAANQYLYSHHIRKKPRMDVIEVYLAPSLDGKKPKIKKIVHIQGAY